MKRELNSNKPRAEGRQMAASPFTFALYLLPFTFLNSVLRRQRIVFIAALVALLALARVLIDTIAFRTLLS